MDHVEGGSVYRRNNMKARLSSGNLSYGTWVTDCRQPSIMRRVADAGYDHVVIDMEHSSFSWETITDHCEMARAVGLVPIVRPAELTRASTLRLLELGAMGVMFHDVDDRAEVDELRDWVLNSKVAQRSASDKGQPGDGLVIAIQVETMRGLAAVEEMVAGGTVDMVEIGRGDLASEMGFPSQRGRPEILSAIDRIVAACEANNVAAGVTCLSPEDVKAMYERGVRCLTYSADAFMISDGLKAGVEALRQFAPRP